VGAAAVVEPQRATTVVVAAVALVD